MNRLSDSDDRRWRAVSATHLLWADWPEGHVVYQRPSGKTHLLNAVSHHLLQQVLREPRNVSELVALLDVQRDDDSLALATDSVIMTLERFEELGLVERI